MSLFRSLFDAITGAPPRIPAAERALVEAEAQSEDTPRNILVHNISNVDIDRQQRELRRHVTASSSAAGDAAESGPRQSTEPPGGPGAGHPEVSAPGVAPVVADGPGSVDIPPSPAQGTPKLVGAVDTPSTTGGGADHTIAELVSATVVLAAERARQLEAEGRAETAGVYRRLRDSAARVSVDLKYAAAPSPVEPKFRSDADLMFILAQLAAAEAARTDYRNRLYWYGIHNEARDRAAQFQAAETA